MSEKKRALLKLSPANPISAAVYFQNGGHDPKVYATILELRHRNIIPMIEGSLPRVDINLKTDGGNTIRTKVQQTFPDAIRVIIEAVKENDSSFFRDIADALDFEKREREQQDDQRALRISLLTIYTQLCREKYENAGRVDEFHREDGHTVTCPTNPPKELRPSFREVLAALEQVPELELFFSIRDPEVSKTHIRGLAKDLGLKFSGKSGRPRKP